MHCLSFDSILFIQLLHSRLEFYPFRFLLASFRQPRRHNKISFILQKFPLLHTNTCAVQCTMSFLLPNHHGVSFRFIFLIVIFDLISFCLQSIEKCIYILRYFLICSTRVPHSAHHIILLKINFQFFTPCVMRSVCVRVYVCALHVRLCANNNVGRIPEKEYWSWAKTSTCWCLHRCNDWGAPNPTHWHITNYA